MRYLTLTAVMRYLTLAAAAVISACGGSDGPTGPDPEPFLPTAAQLVPETIPYDSLGGSTIFFDRWLGGQMSGYVRLSPGSRSASVGRVAFFRPHASAANNLVAFRNIQVVTPQGGGTNILETIAVRPFASMAQPTRVSRDDVKQRGAHAWSADGQYLYYLEGSANAAQIVRQSPVMDASDRTVVAQLSSACDWSDNPLAVASTGDIAMVLFTQTGEGCRGRLFRWNSASNELVTVIEVESGGVTAWSPDGLRLALFQRIIASDGGPPRIRVRTMNRDGSNLTTILDVPAAQVGVGAMTESLCWSADASRILFNYFTAPTVSRIWSMRTDGSSLVPITSPVPASPPVAADGTLSCSG